MASVHVYLFTVIILSSLFSIASSRYNDWWQRDEDTIQKRFRQEEEIRINLNHILDNKDYRSDNYREHKHNDESDTERGRPSSHGSTEYVVVEHKDRDGSVVCDNGRICVGAGAFCCRLSDGTKGCCWTTYVYQLWWFWMIWVMIFFLILACSLVCWRRRRARYRYVVMENSQYPNYGTAVHAASVGTTQQAPQGYPYPGAPAAPPVYSPSEKPPAYSS
ncbi:unnamed protein product [Candidula unifasciata]|uniref:Uncharacterized protein n=1 Tax=Candidula unifasciata TaxID=100452 RepID=A0A8S4A3N9_9EUPU|nr:unnamed protein product [Candidula unifasciata]